MNTIESNKEQENPSELSEKLEDTARVNWWNPGKIFEGLPEALKKAGFSSF